jgi:antitoxin MazE
LKATDNFQLCVGELDKIYFVYLEVAVMKTQIGRWGNSLAIRIPKYIVDELALAANSEVDCRLENGVLIIQPLHQLGKYSLQQLIRQELEDEKEIVWGEPVGEEEW